MTSPDAFLDQIHIATPCSASWDAMQGDDRRRFCGDCRLHVYNLSAMTGGEAERLLRSAEGRVCTRFFRRADGTVVTQDCGPVRRALVRRLRRMQALAATLLGALSTFALAACGDSKAPPEPAGPSTSQTDPGVLPVEVGAPVPLMGEVCVPDEHLGRVVTPVDGPGDGQGPKPDRR